jgi:hypothetical protein
VGQIQIERSKGALQTVQTTPTEGEAVACDDCSPEGSILDVIKGIGTTAATAAAAAGLGGIINDIITVPKEVSGGTTDAVTLPAAVWQIPTGTTGITTLPANVADLPTTGVTTLPAPAPDYKACINNAPLGMCYVPMQKWETPFKEDVGFEAGTIFPSLALKFDAEKGCAVK